MSGSAQKGVITRSVCTTAKRKVTIISVKKKEEKGPHWIIFFLTKKEKKKKEEKKKKKLPLPMSKNQGQHWRITMFIKEKNIQNVVH